MTEKTYNLVEYSETNYAVFSDDFKDKKFPGSGIRVYSGKQLMKGPSNSKVIGISVPKAGLTTALSHLKDKGFNVDTSILKNKEEKTLPEEAPKKPSEEVPKKQAPKKKPVKQDDDEEELVFIEVEEDDTKEPDYGSLVDSSEKNKNVKIKDDSNKKFQKYHENTEGYNVPASKRELMLALESKDYEILARFKSEVVQTNLYIEKMYICKFKEQNYRVYNCKYYFSDSKVEGKKRYDKVFIIFTNTYIGALRISSTDIYETTRNGKKINTGLSPSLLETYKEITKEKEIGFEDDTDGINHLLRNFIASMHFNITKCFTPIRSKDLDRKNYSKLNYIVINRNFKWNDTPGCYIMDWMFGKANLETFEDDFFICSKLNKNEKKKTKKQEDPVENTQQTPDNENYEEEKPLGNQTPDNENYEEEYIEEEKSLGDQASDYHEEEKPSAKADGVHYEEENYFF